MSTAFNGRIAAANRVDTPRLQILWTGAIYEIDYWAIVKGSPQRELALKYVNFATSEKAQLAFSREIPYGPTHFNAILKYDSDRRIPSHASQQALIDLSMLESDLPSAPGNLRKSLPFNADFWDRNGARLDERFNAAMAK